jgi:hypothetical protein
MCGYYSITYIELEGDHDIDHEWLKRIRNANPAIKILPRVYIDFDSKEKFQRLNTKLLIQLIMEKAKE